MRFRLGSICFDISFYFFALLAAFFILEPDGAAAFGALAAMIHECGHLTAMTASRDFRATRVRIGACGVRIQARSSGQRGWMFICVAGAAANLLSATVMLILATPLDSQSLSQFAYANVFLGIVNLLPVEPLDGGQLLRALLLRRVEPSRTDCACFFVSLAVLLPLICAGLWLLMRTRFNFSLLLLALWLLAGLLRDYLI